MVKLLTDMWCNSWGGNLFFDFFQEIYPLLNGRVEGPVNLDKKITVCILCFLKKIWLRNIFVVQGTSVFKYFVVQLPTRKSVITCSAFL